MVLRSSAVVSVLALLASLLPAQQHKVLPAGMGFVEGPLVYTYPFGRHSGAIQLLYDADQITAAQGVLQGMRFRQSQVTATQTHPGYTKNYKVTAYTVTTSAAAMQPDPALNIGGAAGTVVFQGPLTLPPIQPLATQPAAFGIHIPFAAPYVFDGSQGNLLLIVETDDTSAVPPSYRLDAVNFTFGQATGLTTGIDAQGCVVNGESLTLACSEVSVTVGGSLTQTITSSSTGAFPLVAGAVGFDVQQVDLGSIGMPGCTSWPVSPLAQFAFENGGGGYPAIVWTLPNDPSIEGLALASQALGIAASGLLGDSVTSNGVGSRIGGATGPANNMGMSFRSATGNWFMGTNGVFMAVVELEGVFP